MTSWPWCEPRNASDLPPRTLGARQERAREPGRVAVERRRAVACRKSTWRSAWNEFRTRSGSQEANASYKIAYLGDPIAIRSSSSSRFELLNPKESHALQGELRRNDMRRHVLETSTKMGVQMETIMKCCKEQMKSVHMRAEGHNRFKDAGDELSPLVSASESARSKARTRSFASWRRCATPIPCHVLRALELQRAATCSRTRENYGKLKVGGALKYFDSKPHELVKSCPTWDSTMSYSRYISTSASRSGAASVSRTSNPKPPGSEQGVMSLKP